MAVKFLKDENGKLYKDTATGKLLTVDTALPELANPATAEDITSGKEAYGADGAVITGTAEKVENKLPTLIGVQDATNSPYEITASDLDGVTEIRGYSFRDCIGLRSIALPTTCTSIGDYSFQNCTALTSIDMPKMTSIGAGAFYNCTALPEIDMPSATSIGSLAFSGCSKLQSVNMPNVTSIGANAFNTCTKLTSVNMPNVISIGGSAFRRSSLSSALIGSACTSIANNAFYETQGGVITIEATTPPALGGTSAFTNGTRIIVPVGCGEAYKTATNWTTFADYIEEATE